MYRKIQLFFDQSIPKVTKKPPKNKTKQQKKELERKKERNEKLRVSDQYYIITAKEKLSCPLQTERKS